MAKRSGRKTGETLAGVAVVCALVAVGVGLYAQQSRYDPSAFRAPPTLGGTGDATPASAPGDLFGLGVLDGLTAAGPIARFDAETLYQKINGKADLYLSAGFVELRCQRYGARTPFEACAYDMGEPRGAYAVYSSQRRDDAAEVALPGATAYATGNALFVAVDRFYLELVASAGALEAPTRLARTFTELHRPAEDEPRETELFPEAGLDAAGRRLIPDSAFGFSKLDQVYVAPYTIEGGEALAFFSRRADAAEAEALAAAYAAFLARMGASPLPDSESGELRGARELDVLGSFELVFVRGRFLAGVHEAATRELAWTLARRLDARLQEAER